MGAAMELEKSGTPYILLEARDRLGGRSWTSTPVGEGMPLDMGSSWIHGTIDNPIMKFAKEFSLPTTPGDWNTWSTSYAYWTNGSLMSENAKESAPVETEQTTAYEESGSQYDYEEQKNSSETPVEAEQTTGYEKSSHYDDYDDDTKRVSSAVKQNDMRPTWNNRWQNYEKIIVFE